MLDAIKAFFTGRMAPPTEGEEVTSEADLRLAACALLLELAHADDEFSEDERFHLEGVIRRQFLMEDEDASELIALAQKEWAQAVDLWQFTHLIAENYSIGQKMVLLEAMWGLVYADGDLASHEDYLMRRISNLLGLKPGYLAEARKRVDRRLRPPGHDID